MIYVCHVNVLLEDCQFAIHLHVQENLTNFVRGHRIKKCVVQIGHAQEVRYHIRLEYISLDTRNQQLMFTY